MTQEQIDAIILDFLKAYKAWADEDAPEGGAFDPSCGLCTNLGKTCILKVSGRDDRVAVKEHFESLLGDKMYPFTPIDQYEDDSIDGVHHRNPARMAWVNEQIERMER